MKRIIVGALVITGLTVGSVSAIRGHDSTPDKAKVAVGLGGISIKVTDPDKAKVAPDAAPAIAGGFGSGGGLGNIVSADGLA